MAPKNKGITATDSSRAEPPVPTRTGDGVLADGGGGADHDHPRHCGNRSQASDVVRAQDDEPRTATSNNGAVPPTGGTGTSKGGAVLPTGGAATSKTPPPAPAPRSSQVVRDEQHRNIGDPGRRRGKSPLHHSRDAQGRHARQDAGQDGAGPQNCDDAPSNMVRSPSTSRSSRLSLPPMLAEALARVQLLLDFRPTTEKQEEWRDVIQSLIGHANKD